MVAKAGDWKQGNKDVRWTLAPALVELMENVDDRWPHRAKQSDGSIASVQHLANSPNSDHNPKWVDEDKKWLVTAVDITHNVKQGVDCNKLWDALLHHKDGRIKYVIFDRQIFNSPRFNTAGARRRGPWTPGRYTGYSPHEHHIHVSIWKDKADATAVWELETIAQRAETAYAKRQAARAAAPPPAPAEAPIPALIFNKEEAQWLKAFADTSMVRTVNDRSLAYVVETIRALRHQLGLPTDIAPDELARHIVSYLDKENQR